MKNRIYIQKGRTLLPDNIQPEDIFLNSVEVEKVDIRRWDCFNNKGDCHLEKVYGAFLEDISMKEIGADRMVRKTTECQSRWLIAAGVSTWNAHHANNEINDAAGLYLGLGMVDCDDGDDEHKFIESCTAQYLSDFKLTHNKPLLGLILLNSTAASHISKMTGIVGPNCSFAPLTDAGSNALIEASYDLREGRIMHALCGGGSQKITPWLFLAYEDYWQSHDKLWLTEAASFVTMSAVPAISHNSGSEVELYRYYRGRISGQHNSLSAVIFRAFNETAQYREFALQQVLFVGYQNQQRRINDIMSEIGRDVAWCFIENKLGYTGAAGAALALNVAICLLDKNVSIYGEQASNLVTDRKRLVLLVISGAEQQVGYLLIGDKNSNE